jgi:UDP-N-acetyl-D-glucosamine/UDP-N-acetyl-D-galactosamine dehydrogenase
MKKIAIIGQGYVGLPLAIEFGKKFQTIGFDISKERVRELSNYEDNTLEVEKDEFLLAQNLSFTNNYEDIRDCNIYIIAVPTPVNELQRPDLDALIKATKIVGGILNKDDIIIYESTVYPGCTEEECVPVLEEFSDLVFNSDFFVGYSPERVNPGDAQRKLADIIKVTSGSTAEIADTIDSLYSEIIKVGTYKAPSIRVAEAAKIVENIQRDVNIAIINELAIIFNQLEIDTEEVLKAASTKWNFLPFTPGLVGGHCIGIDPYYLKFKAQSIGYNPEIISAVRHLNDGMGYYVVEQLVQSMTKKNIKLEGSNILIMGLSFKENCPDLRNTRVIDVVKKLEAYNANVSVFDPWVSKTKAKKELNIDLINKPELNNYDAIMITVAHDKFKDMGISGIEALGKKNRVIYDLKYLLPSSKSDLRL